MIIGRIDARLCSAVLSGAILFESFLSASLVTTGWRCMKATKFDRDFDTGKSVAGSLDLAGAPRPLQEQRWVSVDFPAWMIEGLDREAGCLGVTRQSIIKVWLAERLRITASNQTGRR